MMLYLALTANRNTEVWELVRYYTSCYVGQVSQPDTTEVSTPGVTAYQFMLEQNVGRTMLQFQVITTPIFQKYVIFKNYGHLLYESTMV